MNILQNKGRNDPMKAIVVVVPNVFEYASRWFRAVIPDIVQSRIERYADGYAELGLFWSEMPKVLVTPRTIQREFVSYVCQLLGYGHVEVVVPRRGAGGVSERLLNDEEALLELTACCEGHDIVEMRSWGATLNQYRVRERLESKIENVDCLDLPHPKDHWCVDYLDSKSTFRVICGGLSHTAMALSPPEGYLCSSLATARNISERLFWDSRRLCLLKRDRGVGGLGNITLRARSVDGSFEAAWEEAVEALGNSPFFSAEETWVVEEIVRESPNDEWDGRIPRSIFMSGEVGRNGRHRIVGGGVDYRDASGGYAGAELGYQTRLSTVADSLLEGMDILGQLLSRIGYRGHWGVNFVIDRIGRPRAVELNPRRCGESHAYSIAETLYGPDWMGECYVLSRLPWPVSTAPNEPTAAVIKAFADVNDRWEGKAVVCIPTLLGWLSYRGRRGIGYAIFGPDSTVVAEAERSLHGALEKVGIRPEARAS